MQTWHVRTLLNRHAGLKFARRNNTRTRDISSSTRRDNVNNPDSKIPPFSRSAFRFTEPPDPSWKIGDGANEAEGAGSWKKGEEAGWKTWNLADTPSGIAYRILTSAIIPRPIAFVSSLSSDGIPNLAPFSYFSMVNAIFIFWVIPHLNVRASQVTHNPPLLSVSFSLSPKKQKDTRENILATKEFVVNIISEPFVEAANSASVEAPADVDEWIWSGLTKEPSLEVRPARVKESAISFECKLYQSHDISPSPWTNTTATLVLGHIKMIHIRNSVLTEDGFTVDPGKLIPVARLGVTAYARLVEAFNIPRASWKNMRGEFYQYLRDTGRD